MNEKTMTTDAEEFVPMAVDYEETPEEFEARIVSVVEARMGAIAASKLAIVSIKD